MRAKLRRLSPMVAVAVLVGLVFVASIVFFAYRDGRAVDRCEALGGQTWDSGQHCAIGVDRVVDTHNRTWG